MDKSSSIIKVLTIRKQLKLLVSPRVSAFYIVSCRVEQFRSGGTGTFYSSFSMALGCRSYFNCYHRSLLQKDGL